MTHPDNDTLLRYALDTTDPGKRDTLQDHLSGCPECSEALAEISADMSLISEYHSSPDTRSRPAPPLPVLRYYSIRTAFRAAAAVAVILLGGYLATTPAGDTRVTVIPQRFTPPAIVIPAGEFAPCEAIDIAHL